MEKLIDFLIIGAQKAGTTTLHDLLAEHSDIFMPAKDIQFFVDAGDYSVYPKDFPLYYRDVRPGQTVGGSQVQLLFSPESVDQVFNFSPRVKLVAVLRNPIDRAYSAYWFQHRKAWEDSGTFESALAREPERAKGKYRERAELTYLAHGHYAEQIQRWRSRFPREQMWIGLFEDLKDDPQAFLAGLLSWLGVSPKVANSARKRSNTAARPRFAKLQRLLTRPPTAIRGLYKKAFPLTLQLKLQEVLVKPLVSWNEIPTPNPPMSPQTREALHTYFTPHNERLSEIIGRDLTHWR